MINSHTNPLQTYYGHFVLWGTKNLIYCLFSVIIFILLCISILPGSRQEPCLQLLLLHFPANTATLGGLPYLRAQSINFCAASQC